MSKKDDNCKKIANLMGFKTKEEFYASFNTNRQAVNYLKSNNYSKYEDFLILSVLEMVKLRDPEELVKFLCNQETSFFDGAVKNAEWTPI